MNAEKDSRSLFHWQKLLPDWVRKAFEEYSHGLGKQKVDYPAIRGELLNAVDEENRRVRDAVYVRPTYVISLAPKDMEDVVQGQFQEVMETALTEDVQNYITERGYILNSRVKLTVKLRADARLQPGFLGISATWTEHDPTNKGFVTIRAPRGTRVATLKVIRGQEQGRDIPLNRFPVIIGRDTPDSGATVLLQDPESVLSRKHLRLDLEGETVYATDLDSANGTTLVGVADPMTPQQRYPLSNGARLILTDLIEIELNFASGNEEP